MAMTSDHAWEEIARRQVKEWRRDRNNSLRRRSGYDVSQDWSVSIGYAFCCRWRIAYRKAQLAKYRAIPGYGDFA